MIERVCESEAGLGSYRGKKGGCPSLAQPLSSLPSAVAGEGFVAIPSFSSWLRDPSFFTSRLLPLQLREPRPGPPVEGARPADHELPVASAGT